MTSPILVLHFADTHIGVESYGKTDYDTGLSSRVRDFLRRMDEMINFARENDVDLVIFAGDAFHSRSPNPTYQREFAHRIRDLKDLAPVVLLVGNHDLPINPMRASSVEIYDTLAIDNVHVAAEYRVERIETKRGPVVVATAPYPLRPLLMNHANIMTDPLSMSEINKQMQEILATTLVNMTDEADRYGDIPRLLVGHFTVSGSILGSEQSIVFGRDVTVNLPVIADDRWDYVALGHIHKHQNLTRKHEGKPPVVYSGSLERIDFGEEGDVKGFCWVKLARHQTEWEFIKSNARHFVTLETDLRHSEKPTRDVIKLIMHSDLSECVVRIRVQLTPQTQVHFHENEIRHALKKAGVFSISGIRKSIDQPTRVRLRSNPEELSPMDLLTQYLQNKDVEKPRQIILLQLAEHIFNNQE